MVPILTNGDPIGSVTVLPTENHALTEAEVKTAELGAKLLACQMENKKRASAYGSGNVLPLCATLFVFC